MAAKTNRTKGRRGRVRSSGRKQPKIASAAPEMASIGLPRMPANYGLKDRKDFLPWEHARQRLERSRNYWICSSRSDGRPHAMPVWGHWIEDVLYFGTGRSSRKGKNLARNPAVSVHLESGDDAVIVEGKVSEVSDRATLEKVDAAYRKKYKMPLNTDPDTVLYAVRPRVVMAWTEKNFLNDATRWELREK